MLRDCGTAARVAEGPKAGVTSCEPLRIMMEGRGRTFDNEGLTP
jgi:hypothetical protein